MSDRVKFTSVLGLWLGLLHTPHVAWAVKHAGESCVPSLREVAVSRRGAPLKYELPEERELPVGPPEPPRIESPFERPARVIHEKYREIFDDTYAGFERMRGDGGLIMDTVHLRQDGKGGFTVEPYKSESAPTDIGLDLIVQSGLLDDEKRQDGAAANLRRIVSALERLPRHEATGLFFRLYDSRRGAEQPALSRDLSSIDNLHLALGLWTAAQALGRAPAGDPRRRLADRARALFASMDFSVFLDESSGLVGGNLRYENRSGTPEWTLEAPRYRFGSEARSLYTVGYALGLFRKSPDALRGSLAKVPLEWTRYEDGTETMSVWDGGIFQQFLPRTLVNEELYSRAMRRNFASSARYVVNHPVQIALPDGRLAAVAVSPTATVTDVKPLPDGRVEVVYSGKLGIAAWKESMNRDQVQPDLVVPHGLLLAGPIRSVSIAGALTALQGVRSGKDRFYLPGFGFTGSLRLATPHSELGARNPVVNSAAVGVDKGIELLSLMQILDPQGLSPSARELARDPVTRQRLREAFTIIDARWARAHFP